MSFAVCKGHFIIDHVLEIRGDAAHVIMNDGARQWTYLPSLEPEDREKILREVETQIIMNSAAGPDPVRPEAGGVKSWDEVYVNEYGHTLKSIKEESMAHKQSGAQSVTIPAGTYTSESLGKEIAIGLHTEDGIRGETPKRTRTVRPRDPEAEAIASITQAELKRNERIDKAKEVYDGKVDYYEHLFKLTMQDTLTALDDVTRARVGKWIADRYGTI